MEPNCKKCKCIDGQCFNKKEPLISDLLLINPLDLLSVDPLAVDPLNIEYFDVEIPILHPKINVNMDEELEPLKEESIVDLDLEKVMTDIESTANFNSVEESLEALNNHDIIFTRLRSAFDTFKELIGRQMTYSEMRNMMG
jgi:hypothetical protein